MKSFVAEVVDIREESRVGAKQRWQMLLDQTGFSIETSLGRLEAVARSGARLEVPVFGVLLEDGDLWHLVDKPLTSGTQVTGYVDESCAKAG